MGSSVSSSSISKQRLGFNDLPDSIKKLIIGSGGLASQYSNLLSGTGSTTDAYNKQYGYLSDVLSGKYMDTASNPYYQASSKTIMNQYNDAIANSRNRSNQAGQYFSSAGQQAENNLASRLSDSLATLAGNVYNTERSNQTSAIGDFSNLYTNRDNMINNLIQTLLSSVLTNTKNSNSSFGITLPGFGNREDKNTP